jgi:RimJ/RimL family protein N-acetyltransferase
MIGDIWPLFNLKITTPRLELRLPTDDEIAAVALAVKASGIHGETIPFVVDWANRPSPEFERGVARFHWAQRAAFTPEAWNLPLSAFMDGEPIGTQDIGATKFADHRSVATGSWLLKNHQGQGLGKEMRAAVLELAFVGLDAYEALSESRVGNEGSAGVSRSLGYEANGMKRTSFGDQVDDEHLWRLTRGRWQSHRSEMDITIEGLEACRSMFGIADDGAADSAE